MQGDGDGALSRRGLSRCRRQTTGLSPARFARASQFALGLEPVGRRVAGSPARNTRFEDLIGAGTDTFLDSATTSSPWLGRCGRFGNGRAPLASRVCHDWFLPSRPVTQAVGAFLVAGCLAMPTDDIDGFQFCQLPSRQRTFGNPGSGHLKNIGKDPGQA